MKLEHADWFSAGDCTFHRVAGLLVLCDAIKCAVPRLLPTLKAHALQLSVGQLPDVDAIWQKPDNAAARNASCSPQKIVLAHPLLVLRYRCLI